MSDIDYKKITNNYPEESHNNNNVKNPNYLLSFLAGLGASVLVAIILAVIAIASESEYSIVLVIGAISVSYAIRQFVPRQSIGGAVIGAILTPATYLLYQVIMNFYGYYYTDGESWFWFMLIGSVILGAFMGYNNDDD